MATEKESTKTKTAQNSTQSSGQTRILWDDSDMRSSYANVSNVAGGREEIVLLFGMNQSWHAAQKQVKVQLSDRIVLSPFAAKRLSLMLNNVISDYEKKFGQIEIEVRRPEGTTVN